MPENFYYQPMDNGTDLLHFFFKFSFEKKKKVEMAFPNFFAPLVFKEEGND